MIDLDDVLAHAHDNCAVCEGTGVVRCWSPGGPCPDGQTVCESCGPCQQSDVPTLVAALREARAGWAADYAVQDDRIGELQAERDDWRRRYERGKAMYIRQAQMNADAANDWKAKYEALRDGVLSKCDQYRAWGYDEIPTVYLREVVARVEES